MPSSESVLRKRQSVPDLLFEVFAFMSFCLSSGDDPDYPLCLLDKDNNDHSIVEKPDADLAILAIVASRVEPDEHRSVEDGVNIGEVHAVPAEFARFFSSSHSIFIISIVHTRRSYVNTSLMICLPVLGGRRTVGWRAVLAPGKRLNAAWDQVD